MKQFLTVLKFELNNYFKNKSFTVTTLDTGDPYGGRDHRADFDPRPFGEKGDHGMADAEIPRTRRHWHFMPRTEPLRMRSRCCPCCRRQNG